MDREHLILHYLTGKLTPEERHAFELWRMESDENQKMLDDFQTIWHTSKDKTVPMDFHSAEEWEKFESSVYVHEKTSLKRQMSMLYQQPWLKIAATFLLLCISSYLIYQSFFRSDIYSIQAGDKISHAVLPDGSEVWLNTESRLSYHKGFVKDREVTLEGEAFFDVKKDREHTFTIRTNDAVVQVLGTSFNVRAYKGEILTEVFVVTGKVSVKTDDDNIVLSPGMTGVLSSSNHQLSINTEADVNRLAWKNKELIFKKTPLKNVVKTLSFYFKKDFSIRNKELNNCRFTGSFKDPLLDEVLETLTLALDLDFKIDQQNSYIIDGVGCKDKLK